VLASTNKFKEKVGGKSAMAEVGVVGDTGGGGKQIARAVILESRAGV